MCVSYHRSQSRPMMENVTIIGDLTQHYRCIAGSAMHRHLLADQFKFNKVIAFQKSLFYRSIQTFEMMLFENKFNASIIYDILDRSYGSLIADIWRKICQKSKFIINIYEFNKIPFDRH